MGAKLATNNSDSDRTTPNIEKTDPNRPKLSSDGSGGDAIATSKWERGGHTSTKSATNNIDAYRATPNSEKRDPDRSTLSSARSDPDREGLRGERDDSTSRKSDTNASDSERATINCQNTYWANWAKETKTTK